MTFRGLTWDHPRGYDALAAASERVNATRSEPLIVWDKQPLEGFESAPLTDLAARYDLIVLDHPHIGEAVATDCLIPLEDLYDRDRIAGWAQGTVGRAFKSYRWDGRTYAVPLDVAHQVMARRADRVPMPPADWKDVEAIARTQPVAQSLAGPHAYLTLLSIVGGWGEEASGDEFLPHDSMARALDIMARLYERRPTGTETLNPIGLLRAMSETSDIALVPLVFGYVTYAVGRNGAEPVRFTDGIGSRDGQGGVLGGTGIGFSRTSEPTPDLLEHIAWLMDEQTQIGFIPAHGGQPSARGAWLDASVNLDWGDFYRDTLTSAERALLRPRFDGVSVFQNEASTIIRDALAERVSHSSTIRVLRAAWRRARQKARGTLDDSRGDIR